MNLTDEFTDIRQWAYDKGILTKGSVETQTVKLTEEVGELAAAVIRKEHENIKDAIGDIVVVLTSLAALADLKIEDCINEAYYVIKNRKGKNVGGNFIKEEDFRVDVELDWLRVINNRQNNSNFSISDVPPDVIRHLISKRWLTTGKIITKQGIEHAK